jgi:hypothetical protein
VTDAGLRGYRFQFNDRYSTQTQGGILVYYVSDQPGRVTAFKPVCRNSPLV